MPRQIVRDFGTCLSFNGSNQSVFSPTIALTGNNTVSISIWVKLRAIPASRKEIFAYENSGDYATWEIYAGVTSTGAIEFGISDPSATTYGNTTATLLKVNVWNHVVLTCAPSSVAKVYINGVVDANTSAAIPSNFTFRGTSPIFEFGGWSGPAEFLNCFSDEIKVYSRALTATEVADLYYGFGIATTNLHLWYKLDEGSGTSATDSSGNSNTGTLTNTPTYSSDVFIKSRSLAV